MLKGPPFSPSSSPFSSFLLADPPFTPDSAEHGAEGNERTNKMADDCAGGGGAGGTVRPENAIDETVAVVDERGNVTGHAPRRRVRAENLRHQATFIFAQSRDGRLYVQLRAKVKDYCPGQYEPCSGGVLARGEAFPENARRELEEELGIAGVPMRHCGSFLYEDECTRVWGDMWDCVYDGPLRLQEEEVEAVEMWTADECVEKDRTGAARFTPDGMHALRAYMAFVRDSGPPAGSDAAAAAAE